MSEFSRPPPPRQHATAHFLEIGVETGATFDLAECAAVGVDPAFVRKEFPNPQRTTVRDDLRRFFRRARFGGDVSRWDRLCLHRRDASVRVCVARFHEHRAVQQQGVDRGAPRLLSAEPRDRGAGADRRRRGAATSWKLPDLQPLPAGSRREGRTTVRLSASCSSPDCRAATRRSARTTMRSCGNSNRVPARVRNETAADGIPGDQP